jgi:hypothetical protein
LAKISKEDRDRDAVKAMAEYEAAGLASRKNTIRLRELRLAKEAADEKAADKKKAQSAVKTVAKKKKRPAAK